MRGKIRFDKNNKKECFNKAKECIKFARENGLERNWKGQVERLRYLAGISGVVVLYNDFTLYSFTWSGMCFGGLIFHGVDGRIENGSVSLQPSAGWSIHT